MTGYIEWLQDLSERERRGEEVDPRVLHDQALEELDRIYEYVEQPHPRERRLWRAAA